MGVERKRDGMNVIEAIVDGVRFYDTKKDSGKNDAVFADRNLKLCEGCGRIWELEYECGRHRQLSYSHIPKIGKGKCKCPKCRANDGEKAYLAWDRGKSTEFPLSHLYYKHKK